eukprot:CAMPEP_0177620974 /NCGR_PEP_ID=MMETSP0419_2-20121207/27273_1 /TAXON_ID=582737 /ORGANISM="Tetraselmis sp., Strain GSL018" /LENGTH=232 /DNA_ID=CAMNT_0019120731 /DNA_START=198 /DNA_END=897 /DNA_ORIENTATION=-
MASGREFHPRAPRRELRTAQSDGEGTRAPPSALPCCVVPALSAPQLRRYARRSDGPRLVLAMAAALRVPSTTALLPVPASDAGDVRAHATQLLLNPVVSAVDVPRLLQRRNPAETAPQKRELQSVAASARESVMGFISGPLTPRHAIPARNVNPLPSILPHPLSLSWHPRGPESLRRREAATGLCGEARNEHRADTSDPSRIIPRGVCRCCRRSAPVARGRTPCAKLVPQGS